MLRIIVVFCQERAESDHCGRHNDTMSPEQNVFSKVHTICICKNLQRTVYNLIMYII